MSIRSAISHGLALVAALTLMFVATPQAMAAGDCGGGWVDGAGGYYQNAGCASEDTHLSGTGNFGDCYGQCGRGCSWYRCGSGGACETHDYYTRTRGLWSWDAMSRFPAAIVQWGSCITGRGYQWLTGSEYSKTTGRSGGANPRVN
jgi:hypothetical protein